MQMLSIAAIRLDERCQPRAAIDPELISEYANAMTDGAEFPPLTVFRDGSDYYLADGFHRIAAAEEAGIAHMVCTVERGSVRDAILHAVGANATHGQRRTNLDKRRAVETLLNDPEWSSWSDNEIARRVQVSPTTVGTIRKSLSNLDSDNESRNVKYTDRWGNDREMATANIGKRTESDQVDDWNDDEPEEVPFQLVDMRTGEIVPPMNQTHSMSFVPSTPEPVAHPTTEHEASRIAADIRASHGNGLAIQIADAIYAQCGKRGAA